MTGEPWDEGGRAWGRLAGRGPDAALDALSDVGELRRPLDRAELEAVRSARRAGRSWAEIATRLGVTRQSAWERWRDLDDDAPVTPVVDDTVRAVLSATVPDVCGLTWVAARARLQSDLLYGVSADPELPPFDGPEESDFVVTDQKPAAGEQVLSYSVVTLWLRRGPGSAGQPAPLEPRPTPLRRRGAIDETTGESVR